jgi:CxxC motif-containing protein
MKGGVIMEIMDFICIKCPLGCMIQAELENKEVRKVTGNTCSRGEDYVKKEIINPTRTVTSTVMVINGEIPMVPVKTKGDIPKDKIWDCMRVLSGIKVAAPVHIGDIIIENVAGTNVNIVATKDIKPLE